MGEAVAAGEGVVDAEIAQLRVENAHADDGGVEEAVELLSGEPELEFEAFAVGIDRR